MDRTYDSFAILSDLWDYSWLRVVDVGREGGDIVVAEILGKVQFPVQKLSDGLGAQPYVENLGRTQLSRLSQ